MFFFLLFGAKFLTYKSHNCIIKIGDIVLNEIIGKKIHDLRIIKTGLSQDLFSKQIGVDRTYLSRVESGKQNLTIKSLQMIVNSFGMTLKEFFDEIEIL